MKIYGLPYMGSKRAIAEWVLNNIHATIGNIEEYDFYDLFGGGASIASTAANYENLLTDGFKSVHYNEYNKQIYELVKLCQENPQQVKEWCDLWVSREEFEKYKDEQSAWGGFVSIVWSFNRMGRNYLYSKNYENIKKELYEFYENCDEEFFETHWGFKDLNINYSLLKSKTLKSQRAKYISDLYKIKKYKTNFSYNDRERIIIQGAWHINNARFVIFHLQNERNFETSNLSYEEVNLSKRSLIYLDPPYEETAEYKIDNFNSDELYKWVGRKTIENIPVFLSEYKESIPGMIEISKIKKNAKMKNDGTGVKVYERLFWNGVR